MKATQAQLDALRMFASANGRNWKSELREIWENGRYSSYDLGGADPAMLQGIRNLYGPSWLVRFRFPAADKPAMFKRGY